jgi:deoxycytidylate deaminase
MRSKCISRKVGAIIVGERGYIVGGGWNDVGEGLIGCGDRIIQDIIDDKDNKYIPIEIEGNEEFRKYLLKKYKNKFNHSFCFREEYEKYKISMQNGNNGSCCEKNIELQQKKSTIKAQQYCRALHAEENAIIQTAKIGGVGVRNGTIDLVK